MFMIVGLLLVKEAQRVPVMAAMNYEVDVELVFGRRKTGARNLMKF